MISRHLHFVIMVCALLAAPHGLATAQDEGDTQDTQAEEGTPADGAPEAGAEKPPVPATPERRTLYFIGPKIALDRQLGPSVGTPKSILPQPLISPGSLAVPEPETSLEVGETTTEAGTIEPELPLDVNPSGLPDSELLVPAGPGDEAAAVRDQEPETGTPGQAPENDVDTTFQTDAFQEGILQQIDASGLPVGNGLDTVWQGYGRGDIHDFLALLAQPSLSPTLTRFASMIAASRFNLPEPANDQEVTDFLDARLTVFQSQADREAYVGLIDQLPKDRDWNALARHFAKAHLLKGELTDACTVADTQRAVDQDPYWVRMSAFCMAATGNRAGVDFQLGILEETTALDPVFYQLIDQILVEAEQPAGAVLPPIIPLDGVLPTDILSAAMARLARVNIMDVNVASLNPLAVPLLLENPMVLRDAQSKLIAYLIDRGVVKSEQVAEFAAAFDVSEDESGAISAWLAASEADDEASDDGLDEAEEVVLPFEQTTLQSVLLAKIARHDAEAPVALNVLWRQAIAAGQQAAIAPALSAITDPGSPSALQTVPQAVALLTRAAFVSGKEVGAEGWLRRLRTRVAGEDPDADQALVGLWPVMAVSDGTDEPSGAALDRWWMLQSGSEGGYRTANLLFTILEALGGSVAQEQWSALENGPVLYEGGSLAPAVWRRFLLGMQGNDPVAVLSALYEISVQVGPADLPPAVAGTLVAGLKQMNFEDTARALALEILISQKN